MSEVKYIAYYRVSTDKQGKSGLGLDAQKTAVERFTKNCSDCILATFTEIESGKKDNRPKLLEAIELAKETGATLLVAKLDRLARNLHFITSLQIAKISFVACDMPNANEMTINIMSAIAQGEVKAISDRIIAALKEKAKQLAKDGKKLGRDGVTIEEMLLMSKKGTESIKQKKLDNVNNRQSRSQTESILRTNNSIGATELAKLLNHNGFKTSTGKMFSTSVAYRLLNEVKKTIQSTNQ